MRALITRLFALSFSLGLLPVSALAQPASQSQPAPQSQPSTQSASPPNESEPLPKTPLQVVTNPEAPRRAVEALINDMRHMVQAAQAGGWQIDRYEIEELMPNALDSVCRATRLVRDDALRSLEAQVLASGSLEEAYAREPNLRKLKPFLTLVRTQKLLAEAVRLAETECPFYIKPTDKFEGQQGVSHRFLVSAESEGTAQIQKIGDTFEIGGGGSGRLLFGYGFGSLSAFAGLELSGAGMLPVGAPATELTVSYFMAAPLVLRVTKVNWQYEVETAAIVHFQDDDLNPATGFRVAGGVGVQTHRRLVFLPWGGLFAGWDHFVEGTRPATDFFHAGFRAGFIFN